MSVKRYEWAACDEHACHCDVVESAEGDMVDYEGCVELEARCAALAAENAGLKDFVKACFRAAADGASLDGADIQELGERLGLFGRETYQPAMHGYICGHEAGEDTVYVMKKTPATDDFLAEVRAQGVDALVDRRLTAARLAKEAGHEITARDLEGEAIRARFFAMEIRKGVQS